jgi:hypothetical protein
LISVPDRIGAACDRDEPLPGDRLTFLRCGALRPLTAGARVAAFFASPHLPQPPDKSVENGIEWD